MKIPGMRNERSALLPEHWSEGDVDTNGIWLHYYRTGLNPGAGTTLVLFHGAADSGLCYMRLALRLEARYDVIMLDARGHGLSDAPGTGYNYHQMAADGITFMKIMKLDRPALVGHSMGAEVVAIIAAQLSDGVRCVVLEDPPWFCEEDLAYSQRRTPDAGEWSRGMSEQKSRNVEDLMRDCLQKCPHWDEADLAPWAYSKRQVDPGISEIVHNKSPWMETLGKITCPVLLLTGDNERGSLVTPGTAEKISGLGKKISIIDIAGAGHNIRRDRFGEYLGNIESFLKIMELHQFPAGSSS
jgi:N-formylmaleamate deformylase